MSKTSTLQISSIHGLPVLVKSKSLSNAPSVDAGSSSAAHHAEPHTTFQLEQQITKQDRTMTHLPRRTIFLAAATAIVAGVTGCTGIEFTPWGQPTPTGMENAPYPANLEHLDDILALGKTTLPEGASNITVSPALKTAETSPGAWGYVIAYYAEPQPIRDHLNTHTGDLGDGVDHYPEARSAIHVKDIDMTKIQHPWITGFKNAEIIIERPLGRCWLIIRGGFR